MAEFVIVGGGVYGCATAWELARQGADVVLLEASSIGAGASGGLGKRGVRANGRDVRELTLARAAYERWPTLHAELGHRVGYERTGHLLLFEREHDMASAPARAWAQNRAAIRTDVLDRADIRELEPRVGDAVQLALYCPLDGIADHGATTAAFAAAAAAEGAKTLEDRRVDHVARSGDRASGVVLDDGERIAATRAVLLLANAGAPALVDKALELRLPVWTFLPQVMRTGPVADPPFHSLIGHAHRVVALKRLPDNSIMVSGGWRGRWNPALGTGETVRDQVTGNWNEAVAVFPALAALDVVEADASRLETCTVDGIPIIDELAPSLFVACGWSGHGFAIAPAAARFLADWALSGKRPAPLVPFGYDRFPHLPEP